MPGYEIEFNDQEVQRALQNLLNATSNVAPALREIGEWSGSIL